MDNPEVHSHSEAINSMTVMFGNESALNRHLQSILGKVASQPFLKRLCQCTAGLSPGAHLPLPRLLWGAA